MKRKIFIPALLLSASTALVFGVQAGAHPEDDEAKKSVKKQIRIIKLDKSTDINGDHGLSESEIQALLDNDIDIQTVLDEMAGMDGDSSTDIQTLETEDGQKRVLIKRYLAEPDETQSEVSDADNKNIWIEKGDAEASATGKAKAMAHQHRDGENVKVIVKKFDTSPGSEGEIIDVDDDIHVFVDDDGNVTLNSDGEKLSDHGEHARNVTVEKDIKIENGKKKTRIVINVEEDE